MNTTLSQSPEESPSLMTKNTKDSLPLSHFQRAVVEII